MATTARRSDAGFVTCHYYRVARVRSKDADSAINSRPARSKLAGDSLSSLLLRCAVQYFRRRVSLRLRAQDRMGGKMRRNERKFLLDERFVTLFVTFRRRYPPRIVLEEAR